MRNSIVLLLVVAACAVAPTAQILGAESASRVSPLTMATLDVSNTDWRPRKLDYSLYHAPKLDRSKPAPLIINLHGGGGSQSALERFVPIIDDLTNAGEFPPAIWSTPGAGRSFYMNYQDGSAHWESILMEDYIPQLLANNNVDPDRIYIVGISMGGMGGLRLAFKYPERFAGVAVLEPAIEATLHWADLSPLDSFYREDQYEEKFGSPVDPAYWEANHPIAIAAANPSRLTDAGLAIYFECGDEDMLNLYRGAEYLHRILFDSAVPHEYRLVRGANHIGDQFMDLRFRDALGFINRDMNPIDDQLESIPFVQQNKARAATMGPKVPLPAHR